MVIIPASGFQSVGIATLGAQGAVGKKLFPRTVAHAIGEGDAAAGFQAIFVVSARHQITLLVIFTPHALRHIVFVSLHNGHLPILVIILYHFEPCQLGHIFLLHAIYPFAGFEQLAVFIITFKIAIFLIVGVAAFDAHQAIVVKKLPRSLLAPFRIGAVDSFARHDVAFLVGGERYHAPVVGIFSGQPLFAAICKRNGFGDGAVGIIIGGETLPNVVFKILCYYFLIAPGDAQPVFNAAAVIHQQHYFSGFIIKLP